MTSALYRTIPTPRCEKKNKKWKFMRERDRERSFALRPLVKIRAFAGRGSGDGEEEEGEERFNNKAAALGVAQRRLALLGRSSPSGGRIECNMPVRKQRKASHAVRDHEKSNCFVQGPPSSPLSVAYQKSA